MTFATRPLSTSLGLAAAVLLGAITASPADAAIKCSGQNQLISGNSAIPTPYCQAEYLAQVARSYGVNTSGAKLRNNFNHRIEVCRFVGHDTRVANICGPLRNERSGHVKIR